MKKSLLVLSVMSGLGLAALVGCSPKTNNDLSDTTIKSMQAATSISMLSDSNSFNSGMKRLQAKAMSDSEIKNVKEILPQLDLMLTNGDVFETTTSEEQTVINEVTYEFKDIVKFKDSSLKDVTYTLVYNKESKVEVEKEDDEKEANEDLVEPNVKEEETPKAEEETSKDEEIKTEEKLNGLVLLDETTTYTFESELKTEKETGEEETERSFKVMIDELNYVEVVQEHEIEGNEVESELAYKKVTNGITTLEYSIEIENEDGENEIEYEIGGKEYKLVKSLDENKEEILTVEVEVEGQNDEVAIFKKITSEDGEISYELVK